MITPEEMKEVEFLRNLGEPYLKQVAQLVHLQEAAEETVVFHQGQDSPFIYFVLSGTVGLRVEESGGNSVEVSTIGPGELLGWSPVLGRRAMTATAHTRTRCRLAVLDVHPILDLCERDPRFGVAFLGRIALVLSERLRDTRLSLARALTHRPTPAALPECSD
jgi:CRP-like cAMP-binding protein